MIKKTNTCLALFIAPLLSTLSHAAISFYVSTDSNGDFINASGGATAGTPATWTGDGGVLPDAMLASGSPFEVPLIDDFSSGTLGNLSMDRDGTFFDMSISLTPAGPGAHSGDLLLANPDGSAAVDDFGAFRLNNLQNVCGFSLTVNFDEPVAARLAGSLATVWGIGLRRHSGSGGAYDATVSLGGLSTITSLAGGGTAVPGIPAGNDLINMDAGDDSNLTFTGSPYGSTATNIGSESGITGTSDWVGIHGVDQNSDGFVDNSNGSNGMLDGETEQMYLTSMTIDIKSSDGLAFASNTKFQWSLDGLQYDDTVEIASNVVIPEPSGLTLTAFGMLGLIVKRRR